ncbi:sulfurtransferase complex subunit TusD [Salinimonas iocasae]|uniref:Sulfurtransferase complex subunit TusD n=1 Tax=Salinimonas iocasae TaxID=2572577 RepID=A0A5B7YG47_9ALTE|nr:sulfurtransferase complex subunit TusD [Salinimonas iocasae]QCZ93419.1 sulfurtransferase complex subunit TusD [Salinimonas iocasae]
MAAYSLLITHSPFDLSKTLAAQSFASELTAQGHTLNNIFFYGEGTHHANALVQLPTDEYQWHHQWKRIQASSECALLVCITAAVKRGLVGDSEARETGVEMANIHAPFVQAGLGEFFTQLHKCEKLVQF